jgi:peptidoglycan hydrolase CwlO-like protein
MAVLVNPLTYAAGAVGLVFALALGVQSFRLAGSQRAEARALQAVAEGQTAIERLTTNNSILTANQDRLQAALGEQNASVAALKAASDTATARAETALVGLRGASARARMLAGQVAALKPQGDACVAADSAILEGLRL